MARTVRSKYSSKWPAEDPIGKRFRFPGGDPNRWVTVVVVVGDMHRQGLEKQTTPQVFLPHAQGSADMMDIIVRTASDPTATASAVQSEIQSKDKSVARYRVQTVEEQLGEETSARRFQTTLIGLFSAAALLLSAIGIYGLMHCFVAQRTNEIGLRMALGARQRDVVTLILQQGLKLVGFGIVIGSALALMTTHLLSGLLYGVSANDPITFCLAPTVLLAVASLAIWLPAHRASRIDPMLALRQE